MKWLYLPLTLLAVLLAGPAAMYAWGDVRLGMAWYEADRSRTGLAPDPAVTPEAVVQIYAARAFNWRGMFAMHTWVATKPRGGSHYTIHQVTGWGGPALKSFVGVPDRSWFGSPPFLLTELRGPEAVAAIAGIRAAVPHYPFTDEYRIWPGPNSNTFVAWLVRRVPELDVQLPPIAVGKDYLADGPFAAAPSGSGYQVSLYGVLGLLVAWDEGIELNVAGLVLGVDPSGPAVKLPGIGRIGFGDPWPGHSALPGG